MIVVLGLGISWEILSRTQALNPVLFSRPSDIASKMLAWARDSTLAINVLGTLQTLALGYLLGLTLGVGVGVLVGANAGVRRFLEPFLVFANAIPRITLAPLFIVWFGFELTPKVLTVVVVIVFIVIVTVAGSVREIRPDLLMHARMLGASRMDLVTSVYVPAVTLAILASARTCIGYAFGATIFSEFFGTLQGVGYLLVRSQNVQDSAGIYAALAITAALALLINGVLGVVEDRSSRWIA